MEVYLKGRMGTRWMFNSRTSGFLKTWWGEGNRYDIFRFMERNDLQPLSSEALLERWREVFL